jgi:2,4-dienoyl-CoA reductase-like NADH-dependent reductase (Old Yellow Enzyme family)
MPVNAAAAHPTPVGETSDPLFSPYRLGHIDLANRLVMAPMTRSRAIAGNVPNPLAAAYYAQRASAGLIVSEATQVSPQGVGYIRTPGIHSASQVASRIQTSTAANCRSRRPRSLRRARCSRKRACSRW